ncbi:MAG: 4Fe-4S dicluster domain-containing protein [Firmicutes bacterium]|nr:4Fe-4S dicluster domain-containing protein [Bacillota bacterium]MDY5531064.1 4Fe-4S dicluster domain-containing protein [Pumilibacteraceae bacterium]
MNAIESALKEKAAALLSSGEVARVIGWKKGEFVYDPSPASFETPDSLSEFVYNDYCGANLSKYLINISKKEGKSAVFMKPCDTYSFNQLIKEHRVDREKVMVIGVECQGKLDNFKLENKGIADVNEEEYDGETAKFTTSDGIKTAEKGEVLLEKCLTCKSKKFAVSDEQIVLHDMPEAKYDRFSEVRKLEAMTAEERYKFWRGQLSKCIRCNACRNVCPACSCVKCVFDNPKSGIAAKANDDSFEEQLYHVIRAFHVAGRCTDCGECSRVCPQHIPLALLNRKFIKDIDSLYGEYQAGEESEGKTPLTSYSTDDVDPKEVFDKTEGK